MISMGNRKAEERARMMGRDRVSRVLFRLSVPGVVSSLTTAAYGLVDAAFIGRLGTGAVGAISVAFPLFSIIGGVGLVRLPDFYTRLHAGGVTDTLGAGLILVGLMFHAGAGLVAHGDDSPSAEHLVSTETDDAHGVAAQQRAGVLSVVAEWIQRFGTNIKLLMILLFLLTTSPTSCHALAQSARVQGLEPQKLSKPSRP